MCVFFHNTAVHVAVPSATSVNGDVTTRKGTVSDEGMRVGVQRRAVILRLSSIRPRVCWQLQELVDRQGGKMQRLAATTACFSSSRPRLCWYLQAFVGLEGQSSCKYQQVGRRLLVKYTVVDSSRPVVGQ